MQTSYDRINSIFEFLYSDEFRDIARERDEDFTRKRKLDAGDIAYLILGKRGLSNTLELIQYFKDKNMKAARRASFSEARVKLKSEAIKTLNTKYIREEYDNTPYKTIKGHIILAIDGCVQKLVNKPTLEEAFGGHTNKNGDMDSYNARTSGIFDCLNNIIIDFQIDRYDTSEKELAIKNIARALEFFKTEKILIIFDRYYPSIELMTYLTENNIPFLCRNKTKSYKEEKALMNTNDEIINIQITKNRTRHIKDEKLRNKLLKMKELPVRITKIKLNKTVDDEHLISNLPFDMFPHDEMKELYAQRWEIEKSYDVLKNKLYIENLSAYSKKGVEQDFYAQILMYNMIQDINTELIEELEFKNKSDFKKNENKNPK